MANNKDIHKKTSALNIVVDDGVIEVPILNKQGETVGMFSFNPSDIGIIDRYNEIAAEFQKITEPLERIGTSADEDDAAAISLAKERLFEACNYLFGGSFSDAFFGHIHPFSLVRGRFYCENVLEAVGKFISAQFDREVSRVNARVEKYTRGYRSGRDGADARSGGRSDR